MLIKKRLKKFVKKLITSEYIYDSSTNIGIKQESNGIIWKYGVMMVATAYVSHAILKRVLKTDKDIKHILFIFPELWWEENSSLPARQKLLLTEDNISFPKTLEELKDLILH